MLGKKSNALYELINYTPDSTYDIVLDYEPKLALLTAELLDKTKDFEAEQIIQKQLLESTSTDITPLFDSVFRMTTILGVKSSLVPQAYEWGSAYLTKTDDQTWQTPTALYNSYLDTLFDASAKSMTDSWTIITESYKSDSDSYVQNATDYKNYAQTYTTGFDEHVDIEGMGGSRVTAEALFAYAQKMGEQQNPVYHYPDASIKLYNKAEELSADYIAAIEERQNSLNQN